jgi:hypothetical protein
MIPPHVQDQGAGRLGQVEQGNPVDLTGNPSLAQYSPEILERDHAAARRIVQLFNEVRKVARLFQDLQNSGGTPRTANLILSTGGLRETEPDPDHQCYD